MTYFFAFLGGGLGSLARFLVSKFSGQIFTTNFPIGTFISNMIACALLALFVVLFTSKTVEYPWIQPLWIVGFCGGFSTFSTFGNETFQLMDSGNHLLATLNIVISLVVGIGLIFLIRLKS